MSTPSAFALREKLRGIADEIAKIADFTAEAISEAGKTPPAPSAPDPKPIPESDLLSTCREVLSALEPMVHRSQPSPESGLEPTTARDNDLDRICATLSTAIGRAETERSAARDLLEVLERLTPAFDTAAHLMRLQKNSEEAILFAADATTARKAAADFRKAVSR